MLFLAFIFAPSKRNKSLLSKTLKILVVYNTKRVSWVSENELVIESLKYQTFYYQKLEFHHTCYSVKIIFILGFLKTNSLSGIELKKEGM